MSLVFVTFAILLSVVVIYVFSSVAEKSIRKNKSRSNIVLWVIAAIIMIALLAFVITGGWTLKQKYMTSLPKYQNPQDRESKRKLMATTAPSQEELQRKKAEMKEKDEKRHEKALSDYEKSMKKEHKKIKNRSK